MTAHAFRLLALSALLIAVIVVSLTRPAVRLAAQDGTCAVTLPLPPDVRVMLPAESVPPALAAYSGRWAGRWEDGTPQALVVESVAEGRAIVIDATGRGPLLGGTATGTSRLAATVDGDALVLAFPGSAEATTRYRLRPDGTLDAEFAARGRTARATLSRVEEGDLCDDPDVPLPGFALAPAGALDAGSVDPALVEAAGGGTAYLFRVTGFAVPSLSGIERARLLVAPTDRARWVQNTGRYFLVVVVPPDAPAGSFPVRFALPDGRAAEASLDVPAPEPPLALEYAGRREPGSVRGAAPGGVTYLFRVRGLDIAAYEVAVGAEAFRRSVTRPQGSGVGVLFDGATAEAEYLAIVVPPGTPEGPYPAALALPDGRRAEATLPHAATE